MCRDFDTLCNIISEDVYFLLDEPVCARVGLNGFDEAQTRVWYKNNTDTVPYFIFLEELARYRPDLSPSS